MKFERDYQALVQRILDTGEFREGRKGFTKSIFAERLVVDMTDSDIFPLLMGRKLYPSGVIGEFAALIRGPHHIDDFERFGCNYWKQWAQPNGYINIDYGNLWKNFGGTNQLDELRYKLKHTPMDRRMIVTGWNPANMNLLDLPCCHLLYQWYVREGEYLDMIWYQRSVDAMIGLPSDIILAAVWNAMLANEVGLKPGKITMDLGDTHIYEEHFKQAQEYACKLLPFENHYPTFKLNCPTSTPIEAFTPEMLSIFAYNPGPVMQFELKS